MALGWIDLSDYSFNSFLLMERFQIRYFMSGRESDTEWKHKMGIALKANPAVQWYLTHRCPECAEQITALSDAAPTGSTAESIREAEVYVLSSVEDFVIYTVPEAMDTHCPWIYSWDKTRLYEMADFTDKIVLDVGSGSGRLAFAAAQKAREVYASEPVETLRECIRQKAARDGVANLRVAEALLPFLPYPDSAFDIVMSGHVVGDDWEAEIAELARVCKSGCWLLDCRGDSLGDKASPELVARGWEGMSYIGAFGTAMHNHRKQVFK
ncbi:MAG: class I SAM-dependent methyltransferase [Oscillospiraceae bacterium]|nr:class I SAM-dependent methyltransferase [Oscillospiraceae bacterium]